MSVDVLALQSILIFSVFHILQAKRSRRSRKYEVTHFYYIYIIICDLLQDALRSCLFCPRNDKRREKELHMCTSMVSRCATSCFSYLRRIFKANKFLALFRHKSMKEIGWTKIYCQANFIPTPCLGKSKVMLLCCEH